MKNFFLKLSLFLCGICVAQPMPPQLPRDRQINNFLELEKKPKVELPNKFIRVDFNYGFENTLDFHVVKGKDKNLIGVGYSTYIGNDVKGNLISVTQSYNVIRGYTVRDKAYYLLLGKQIKRLSISAKLGVYTNMEYFELSKFDNAQQKYYAKGNTDTHIQYGGHLSWSANRTTGIALGWDKFNGVTVGVTTLF